LRLQFSHPAASITHSTAPAISQLTALQSLELWGVRALDAPMLTGMLCNSRPARRCAPSTSWQRATASPGCWTSSQR
jgi:hypothetical protein